MHLSWPRPSVQRDAMFSVPEKSVPYMIGFTENHYHLPDQRGQPQSDRRASILSLAFDRAERINKVTENTYQSESADIEKRHSRSVQKLHRRFLDLLYELAARRRQCSPGDGTPLPWLGSRPVSRCSTVSIESSSSVKSLPCPGQKTDRELATLLAASSHSLPSLGPKKVTWFSKDLLQKQPADSPLPILAKSPQVQQPVTTENTARDLNKSMDKSRFQKLKRAQSNPYPRQRPFTRNESQLGNRQTKSVLTEIQLEKRPYTSQDAIGELPNLESRQKVLKVTASKPAIVSMNSHAMRMEVDRLNNIRRRYAAQTKSGPVDFNKLKRQILCI